MAQDVRLSDLLHFHRGGLLGAGRFCQVYKGVYRGKNVAVKRVEKLSIIKVDVAVVRVIITNVNHPNIVKYFAIEQDDDFWYLALEICPYDLVTYVKRNPETSLKHKLDLAAQMTDALNYIHKHDWVHKDIKPSNFLIKNKPHSSNEVVVKLSDLGYSKTMSDGPNKFSSKLDYAVMEWIAPELTNSPYEFTKESDIWALGCVLYFLFSGGGHPFNGSSTNVPSERVINIARGKFDLHSIKEDRTNIKKIIALMIERQPKKRPGIQAVDKMLIGDEETMNSILFENIFVSKAASSASVATSSDGRTAYQGSKNWFSGLLGWMFGGESADDDVEVQSSIGLKRASSLRGNKPDIQRNLPERRSQRQTRSSRMKNKRQQHGISA